MLLRLTDGTETVTLSGDGAAILGCAFVARPPKDSLTPVAEDARVILEGTAAAILTATQQIERLFAVARADHSSNLAVYVEHQREGDTAVYRAQIRDGRLLWSDEPIRRQLFAAATAVEVVVAWERDPWWETADETDAGTAHIYNGDTVGEPDVGDWLGPGGPPTYSAAFAADEGDNAYNAAEWTNIAGVLPTPAHLQITNNDGAAISLKRLYIANDIYARFDGSQHYIASGSAASWTGSSTHATARWTLTPTAGQIAKMVAAGGVRLLGVFASASAGIYVRAALYQNTPGSVLVEAWRGPETLTVSGRLVYDLGFMPVPPDATTFGDWRIVLSVYAGATGSANLDFLQLCPGKELIVLDAATAVSWADSAVVDWWGDERYGAVAGYHGTLLASGRLLLQPERPNRLMIIAESATGVDVTVPLTVGVKYRPRRATI